MFVAQANLVSTFVIYDQSGRGGVAVEPTNVISFIGEVKHMYASANAQHLFTAVSRHSWELEAQTRYLDICTRLKADSTDLFCRRSRVRARRCRRRTST